MSMCKDIEYCAIEMLKKHNLKCNPADKAKIIELLSRYVEYLIFNMISVVCSICLSIGVKKLLEEHMQYLRAYVDKRCSMQKKPRHSANMRGGAFNTAQFYGVPEPQYSAGNASGDIMNVDWQNGIARPAIPMTAFNQGGGASGAGGASFCAKLNKILVRKINSMFKFFKLATKKGMSQLFVKLFDKYMNELFAKLKKICKTELTLKKLQTVINKSQIMK